MCLVHNSWEPQGAVSHLESFVYIRASGQNLEYVYMGIQAQLNYQECSNSIPITIVSRDGKVRRCARKRRNRTDYGLRVTKIA